MKNWITLSKVKKNDDAYLAYSKFIKFDKPGDLSMNKFILEFEHLCTKMKEHDMVLRNNVLTFQAVKQCKFKWRR